LNRALKKHLELQKKKNQQQSVLSIEDLVKKIRGRGSKPPLPRSSEAEIAASSFGRRMPTCCHLHSAVSQYDLLPIGN
jgi:hypothetical protein